MRSLQLERQRHFFRCPFLSTNLLPTPKRKGSPPLHSLLLPLQLLTLQPLESQQDGPPTTLSQPSLLTANKDELLDDGLEILEAAGGAVEKVGLKDRRQSEQAGEEKISDLLAFGRHGCTRVTKDKRDYLSRGDGRQTRNQLDTFQRKRLVNESSKEQPVLHAIRVHLSQCDSETQSGTFPRTGQSSDQSLYTITHVLRVSSFQLGVQSLCFFIDRLVVLLLIIIVVITGGFMGFVLLLNGRGRKGSQRSGSSSDVSWGSFELCLEVLEGLDELGGGGQSLLLLGRGQIPEEGESGAHGGHGGLISASDSKKIENCFGAAPPHAIYVDRQ